MFRSWLATACALALWGAAHAEITTQILRAEPVHIAASELAAARAAPAKTSFQAHGRQFDLTLESNDRLLGRLSSRQKSQLSGIELFRGRIDGIQASWVRLTRSGNRLQGMIWDGREMYVIEPAYAVAKHLLSSVAASGDAPVLYRLADVVTDLSAASCRVVEPGADAGTAATVSPSAKSYDNLVQELRATTSYAATRQMEVAVVGDFEFVSRTPEPRATALARLNVVDGIFSEQVGVRLVFPVIRFFESSADNLDDDDPAGLLYLFGQHKNASADIRDRGVAHLLTGRDLSGTIVGIAYRGAACTPTFGVSLSQGSLTFANATLVIAHEIAHNVGAPHDNEADSPCSATGAGFLMSPRLNESTDRLSQCSLTQVRPMIDSAPAACVTSVDQHDAAVDVEPRTQAALPGQAFVYPIVVTSMGASTVSDVVVTTTLPSSVTLLSASVPEGNCAAGGGSVTCALGMLAEDSSRRIELNVQGTAPGSFASTVTLAASDDENSGNNVVDVTLEIRNGPPPGSSQPGEGSGGGELGWLTLLALLAPLVARLCQFGRSRISSMGMGRPMAKPCA